MREVVVNGTTSSRSRCQAYRVHSANHSVPDTIDSNHLSIATRMILESSIANRPTPRPQLALPTKNPTPTHPPTISPHLLPSFLHLHPFHLLFQPHPPIPPLPHPHLSIPPLRSAANPNLLSDRDSNPDSDRRVRCSTRGTLLWGFGGMIPLLAAFCER